MEVKPHEPIVVKVDVSWRLTLRNRRFVRELDPRKTSLEDYQVHSDAAHMEPLFPPQPVSSAHAQPGQPRHAAALQIGESHRANEQLQTGDMATA